MSFTAETGDHTVGRVLIAPPTLLILVSGPSELDTTGANDDPRCSAANDIERCSIVSMQWPGEETKQSPFGAISHVDRATHLFETTEMTRGARNLKHAFRTHSQHG